MNTGQHKIQLKSRPVQRNNNIYIYIYNKKKKKKKTS
jgi:hypothetical protein